jgi:hypothetical protein
MTKLSLGGFREEPASKRDGTVMFSSVWRRRLLSLHFGRFWTHLGTGASRFGEIRPGASAGSALVCRATPRCLDRSRQIWTQVRPEAAKMQCILLPIQTRNRWDYRWKRVHQIEIFFELDETVLHYFQCSQTGYPTSV